ATYEIRFADKLKSIFKGQQPEIIENLKYGKKENLFNQDKSRQAYTEAATPILSSLITEAITNARRLMDGKKQFGPEADQRSLAWLKTHIEWAALEFGEETAKLLSAKLTEGFALGESMDMLAGRVKDVINFCSDVRSLRIARTETIQASAQGAIEGFKDMGVEQLEFWAALDERTCPSCMALHGSKFKPDESTGIITVHPSCRCTWLPVVD
ncbi:MAG: minor capsid protein, partial [Dehalococcoidia bacterium]|nr:minor capsid protein [Dehalococcoidia bacterium]